MQVLGWDTSGTIIFNDIFGTNNSAEGHGGCFHGSGKSIFNDGTTMLANYAEHGGSICEKNIIRSLVEAPLLPQAQVSLYGSFKVLNLPRNIEGRAKNEPIVSKAQERPVPTRRGSTFSAHSRVCSPYSVGQ